MESIKKGRLLTGLKPIMNGHSLNQ